MQRRGNWTKREMNTRVHAAILVSTLIGMAFARRSGSSGGGRSFFVRREMKMEGAHLSMTDPMQCHCRSREGKETEWNGTGKGEKR